MVKLTIPMVLGIVSLMLLGVVDTYFISLLGTEPLAAASFALPITGMVMSVALGIGMGQSALVSRLVGEGRIADGARFVTDTQFLGLLIGCAISLAGVAIMDLLFRGMGADEATLPLIRSYMSVWYLGSPILTLTFISTNAMRAVGDTKSSAVISAELALLNLILDPLFIFGLGPIPAFGIQGAAIATVLAAIVTLATAYYVLSIQERLIDYRKPSFSHLWPNWGRLLTIGVPAVGANLMTPLAATVMTTIVATYGATAVAGFGVGTRIESLSLLIVFAMSSSLPMFIGQNLGAGKPERAYQALVGCLKFTVAIQIAVYLLLAAGATTIARAFSTDPEVQQIIALFLWIIPVSYGAHGIVILAMVSLNVLQRPRTALALTIIRLAVCYIPLAWIGGRLGGVTGLFFGAAAGNFVAAAWTVAILRKACRAEGLVRAVSDPLPAASEQ